MLRKTSDKCITKEKKKVKTKQIITTRKSSQKIYQQQPNKKVYPNPIKLQNDQRRI